MSSNVQTSTGLRNAMLVAYKTALDHGFLDIYAGAVPASADDAIGGAVLLCTVSVNSTATGVTFAPSPSAGVLSKSSSEVWSGVNLASGTATFYRVRSATDSGTSSPTQPRLQGSVGVTDGSLNLSLGTTLNAGATTPVDSFAVELPTY